MEHTHTNILIITQYARCAPCHGFSTIADHTIIGGPSPANDSDVVVSLPVVTCPGHPNFNATVANLSNSSSADMGEDMLVLSRANACSPIQRLTLSVAV